MDSPPRAGLTRRGVLALAAGAAVTRASRAAAGRRVLEAPRTLQACVASMETLMSPEAIDRISELAEARQFEYGPGIGYLRQARWGEPWGGAVRGPLEKACLAAGFEPRELNDYIVSTMAWRRRGRPLDVPAQLAPFREAHRREKERREKVQGENRRANVRVIGPCYLEILDCFYFAPDAATPSPGQEHLSDAVAKTVIGNPQMAHVEVQAHAAPGEARPAELSRERAVAILEALVQLGVPAERLTAHGLGARFPNPAPENKPKDLGHHADARAEFFILRRITV